MTLDKYLEDLYEKLNKSSHLRDHLSDSKRKRQYHARHKIAELHGKLFQSLITINQAKTIVEIGVMFGSTMKWLCKGADTTGGEVFGFDIWDTYMTDISKEYSNDYPANERHINVPNFGSTWEMVHDYLYYNSCYNFKLIEHDTQRKNFPKVLKIYCPVIDFAFIDGGHSYNAVKTDFFSVYPLLSDTGIIALHDTFFVDGCREFVLDLRTKYNDGTFDIVDFPFGLGDQKVGISLLVKRSYPVIQGNNIRIVQGSPSLSDEIIRREKEWYEGEIK